MTLLPYAVAVALLVVGLIGIITARSAVKTLIGVEIASKGALINFIATDPTGSQGIVVLLILIDAIVVAVVMGMVVAVYRTHGTLDLESLEALTW